MKGDQIPDGDNISRHCGGSTLNEQGWPEASAFLMKEGHDSLSVNWLEYLSLGNRASEIKEIQRVLATKRNVAKKSKLAVLSVGQARAAVLLGTNDRRDIPIRHDPELIPPVDPSHSGIYNLSLDDNTAAEQLANSVLEMHQAC